MKRGLVLLGTVVLAALALGWLACSTSRANSEHWYVVLVEGGQHFTGASSLTPEEIAKAMAASAPIRLDDMIYRDPNGAFKSLSEYMSGWSSNSSLINAKSIIAVSILPRDPRKSR